MQNNLAKIAKWTMCALLAGADMVKLGYVSRAGQCHATQARGENPNPKP